MGISVVQRGGLEADVVGLADAEFGIEDLSTFPVMLGQADVADGVQY